MDQLLLMNPRRLSRGPRRLKNLPPGLRRYWQGVRKASRKHLVNPRRVKRRRKAPSPPVSRGFSMATRRRRRRVHRLSAHQRRSRAARKAARTRARTFAANPRRRHHMIHRRFRRNPRRMGSLGSIRGTKPLLIGAGVGAIGAVGLDYLWQWASGYLPASMQTGYVGTGVKAAAAIGAGWLASKAVGRSTAMAGTVGALTVIGYQLLHQMIASAAPTAAIPATTTAATPALSGMNAYMLNAYMPHSMGRLGWTSPGTPLRGLGKPTHAWGGGGMTLPTFAPGRPGGSVSASGLASAGSW